MEVFQADRSQFPNEISGARAPGWRFFSDKCHKPEAEVWMYIESDRLDQIDSWLEKIDT
jgi:hypothetical protein